MREIFAPRETVNDDSVIVISVKIPSESEVVKGQCLFEIETSKSIIEIDAPDNGIIVHEISVGDTIKVGCLLARLRAPNLTASQFDETFAVDECKDGLRQLVVSKAAMKRARELGVDTSVFSSGFISSHDIERGSTHVSETTHAPALADPERSGSLRISSNKIVILGGGGHARMCIDILRLRNEYEIVGILDSLKPVGSLIGGVKIIGKDVALRKLWDEGVSCAVIGVGSVSDPSLRQQLFHKLKNIGFFLPNLIHPSAVVEPSVKLGEGNQIMMGACVGSDSVIGDNCIVNSGAIVSHDSVLSNHVHISPGAVLAGGVFVGEAAVIGMGVTVYIGLKIGARSVVKNGINLFKDVEPGEVDSPS